jgi:UDP-2-acetamido-2-deoxy-ribo-hexuluronate aminotransferase
MQFIKMVDLHRQYLSIKEEIDAAIQSVLARSDFIMGSAVQEFESQLSRYLGIEFVVGCASGTDALKIAMMALAIGPGDEVITSPFSFVATAESIVMLGARPVYVDIDPKTYNINVEQIVDRIGPKTRAIIPVHLYGQPADMARQFLLSPKKKGSR